MKHLLEYLKLKTPSARKFLAEFVEACKKDGLTTFPDMEKLEKELKKANDDE